DAGIMCRAIVDGIVGVATMEIEFEAIFATGILDSESNGAVNAAVVYVEADAAADSQTAEVADSVRNAAAVVNAPGLATGVDVIAAIGSGFVVVIIGGGTNVKCAAARAGRERPGATASPARAALAPGVVERSP